MKVFGVQMPGIREPEAPPADDPEGQDPLGDEGDAGGDEPDELAGFDDDSRQEIEAIIARREEAARAQIADHVRTQAQTRGFDLAPDGSLLIADPTRVQGWVGAGQREQPVPPPPQPAAAAAPPGPGPMPDPSLYPEEHQRWLDAVVEARFTARDQVLQQQMEQNRYYTAQLAANAATQRVIHRLTESGYQQLATHPEFVTKFQGALMGVDMQYWQDDLNLTRMAFALLADLGPTQQQPPAAPKPGRPGQRQSPQAQQVAESIASRSGAGGFTPSRDQFSQPRLNEPGAEEALYARALGIPVEEVRALKDWTGEKYTDYKTKQRTKRR